LAACIHSHSSKRNEGQGSGLEHNFRAQEHKNHVASHKKTNKSNGEQQGAHGQRNGDRV
jgi:hypothetical protein